MASALGQSPTLDLAVNTAEEVLALAGQVSYEPARAEALLGVVDTLVQAGRAASAAAAARQAFAAAQATEARDGDDATRRATLIGRSAVALARPWCPEAEVAAGQAMGAAESLAYENDRKDVLVESACALTLAGRPEPANEPRAEWQADVLERDEGGYVRTGADLAGHQGPADAGPAPARAPLPIETSVPGVLAAGGVRAGSLKRMAMAVDDGSIVIQEVHDYLGRQ